MRRNVNVIVQFFVTFSDPMQKFDILMSAFGQMLLWDGIGRFHVDCDHSAVGLSFSGDEAFQVDLWAEGAGENSTI
jgi:hypothetical protein